MRFIVGLLFVFCLIGCEEQVDLSTPEKVAGQVLYYLGDEQQYSGNGVSTNYELFQSLLTEHAQEHITEDVYKELVKAKKATTSASLYTTEIIKFDNGEIYVIVYGDIVDDVYQIQEMLPLDEFYTTYLE